MSERSFMGDFRKFFGRGLGILLPSVLTLWILFQLGIFLFQNVAEPINAGLRRATLSVAPRLVDAEKLPDFMVATDEEVEAYLTRNDISITNESEDRADRIRARARNAVLHRQFGEFWRTHWYLQATGLIVAVLIIYLAGLLLGNYLGRSIYNRVEALVARVPGFAQIYPHVKQVVDLIFGESSTLKAFSEVVLFEYPRKGVYTVGLVSGNSFQQVRDETGVEMVAIFVPTSPTPMTGFVVNVPRAETKKLDMTIDQALRFIITAGVLTPDGDRDPSLPSTASGADPQIPTQPDPEEDAKEGP